MDPGSAFGDSSPCEGEAPGRGGREGKERSKGETPWSGDRLREEDRWVQAAICQRRAPAQQRAALFLCCQGIRGGGGDGDGGFEREACGGGPRAHLGGRPPFPMPAGCERGSAGSSVGRVQGVMRARGPRARPQVKKRSGREAREEGERSEEWQRREGDGSPGHIDRHAHARTHTHRRRAPMPPGLVSRPRPGPGPGPGASGAGITAQRRLAHEPPAGGEQTPRRPHRPPHRARSRPRPSSPAMPEACPRWLPVQAVKLPVQAAPPGTALPPSPSIAVQDACPRRCRPSCPGPR